MDVICIKVPGYGIGPITLGKAYSVSVTRGILYKDRFFDVLCDNGRIKTLSNKFFISVEEHRDNQLNKIIS